MKKTIIMLALMLCPGIFIHAQDVIIKTGNDTVRCKILSVSYDEIEYQTLKDGILEKSTVPRKFVLDFLTSENLETHETIAPLPKKDETSSRFAIAGGYARRLGKLLETGDYNTDQVSRDLCNGYSLDAEFQYFFNKTYGMALNVNYVQSSGSASNVSIPDFGKVSYSETQKVLFVGPAFAMRHDSKNWLITSFIGLGPIFYTVDMLIDGKMLKGTCTAFGSNMGIGTEYKISSHVAGGLKLSITSGSTESSNFNERISLSNLMVSAYMSFRTK